MTLLLDILRFLCKKNSVRTTILIISLSEYLSIQDIKQLKYYFGSYAEMLEQRQ